MELANKVKTKKTDDNLENNEATSNNSIQTPPPPKLPGSGAVPPPPKFPGSGAVPLLAKVSKSKENANKPERIIPANQSLPPRKFGTPRNPSPSRSVNKFSKYKNETQIQKEAKPSTINKDLSIPEIPLPKKRNVKLELKDEEIRKDTADTKWILIDCEMCGNKVIQMPVPRDYISNSPLPVTEVGYIHGDPLHCIVAQLDKDFEVRRRRCCKITFEKDYAKS